MTTNLNGSYLFRVLSWHSLLILLLLAASRLVRGLEPGALLLGGLFMGVNFALLCVGIRWTLTPTVSRKRQRVGVGLLLLKLLLFLGLVTAVLLRMELDGLSFIVGVSSLLIASVIGTLSSVPSFSST